MSLSLLRAVEIWFRFLNVVPDRGCLARMQPLQLTTPNLTV